MQEKPSAPPRIRSFRNTLMLAALLVFVDAFVLNQGFISLFFGLGLLFVSLPRTFLPRFAAVRRGLLANLATYGLAVLMVLALNSAHNRLAQRRAERLVSAVKAYRSRHHRYPESLNALIPEFMARLPRAKYTLISADFGYTTSERATLLFYTAVPPFGRPVYNFTRDAWTYLD